MTSQLCSSLSEMNLISDFLLNIVVCCSLNFSLRPHTFGLLPSCLSGCTLASSSSCIYFILSSLLPVPPLPVMEREPLSLLIGPQRGQSTSPLLSLLSQAEKEREGGRESESGEAGRLVATDGFTSGGSVAAAPRNSGTPLDRGRERGRGC